MGKELNSEGQRRRASETCGRQTKRSDAAAGYTAVRVSVGKEAGKAADAASRAPVLIAPPVPRGVLSDAATAAAGN